MHPAMHARGLAAMATDNTTARVPTKGGDAGDKRAIVGPAFGVSQGRAYRAMVEGEAGTAGYTASELVVRYAAIGGPLWYDHRFATRAHWQATHASKGAVHEYSHAPDAGDVVRCRIAHDCGTDAPNAADGLVRWLGLGAADSLAFVPKGDLRAIARKRAATYRDALVALYGVTASVALDTPSLALIVEATGLTAKTKGASAS